MIHCVYSEFDTILTKPKQKTNKMNNDTDNHELTPFEHLDVVTTTQDDVIKVEFSERKSPITLDVVTIQNVETKNRVNQDLVVVPPSEQIDPKMVELIQKIKTIVNSMKIDEKELVHWKKRKFESALVIGEYLVPIRILFGKDKGGFRKLVETEFVNEFCYKTAERYMKLFTNQKDLPSDVCNLREAYISLGILKKEEFLDDEKKPEDVPVTNPPVIPSTPKTSIPKVKDFVSVKKKKLYDHPNSILVGHYRLNSQSGLFQVVVNPDGKMYGVNVEDDSRMVSTKPTFDEIMFERLKPFVEWYNIQNQKKKEIQFCTDTINELDRAA